MMLRRLAEPLLALSLLVTPALAQETRTLTDDTGTEVTIPTDPQRIVALHDTSLTVSLLELGVVPVGSHGRVLADGTESIRSGKLITGYDFDNSNITFVGNLPADVEAVAALEPDLILTTDWQTADVDQLRTIAPTYVFNISTADDFETYRKLAEVVGKADALDKLEARYQAQIGMIRQLTDPAKISVSVIQGNKGQLQVWNTYGSLGKVLRDAGFVFPACDRRHKRQQPSDLQRRILSRFRRRFHLRDLPAEPGRKSGNGTRRARRGAAELVRGAACLPDRADRLHPARDRLLGDLRLPDRFGADRREPCRRSHLHTAWRLISIGELHNQMIVMPREEASATSYYALRVMADTIVSHISGCSFEMKPDRPLVPRRLSGTVYSGDDHDVQPQVLPRLCRCRSRTDGRHVDRTMRVRSSRTACAAASLGTFA